MLDSLTDSLSRDRIPELSLPALEAAAEAFFPNNIPVSAAVVAELQDRFYRSLSLNHRLMVWDEIDQHILRATFAAATQILDDEIPPVGRHTKRLAVIGCGDGRLAETYLNLAWQHGFRHILFNDLLSAHVEIAERHVLDLPEAAGLNISFVAGDIADMTLQSKADLVITMFFVSSEIVDIASAAALQARRQRYYRSFARNLRVGGIFLEDVPERDLPGFYATLGNLTGSILERRGVMQGMEYEMSLTHVPKPHGGYPYHIRCIPGSMRRAELDEAGFDLVYSWCEQARMEYQRGEIPLELRRIKRLDLLQKRLEKEFGLRAPR